MERNRIELSYELFDKLKCCLNGLNGDFSDDVALALVQEDMMRCLIMNCLAALSVVQIQRMRNQKEVDYNEKHELVKRKVFRAACLMMMDSEFDSDEIVANSILSSFPDESKMSDERSWLPMHFAIAQFFQRKISVEDVHVIHTGDLLAMYRLDGINPLVLRSASAGCTPVHLLCMQKDPNMAMVKYFCLRDPKAFLLCDQDGRCALHLAAQYSESVELLQTILQIDASMTKSSFNDYLSSDITPLGLLCRRLEFPTFHKMVACLLEVDSSVEVIYDGAIQCMLSYTDYESKDFQIYPGSRGERTVILLEILLDANLDAVKYNGSDIFYCACRNLRGELGVAVLSSLIIKDSSRVKSVDSDGELPIHDAASFSSLGMMKLLHMTYPESLSIVSNGEGSLIHYAFSWRSIATTDVLEKVKYLCDQCPALIHQKNIEGLTPLHYAFNRNHFDVKTVIWFTSNNESILRDKYTPSNTNSPTYGRLPLHFFVAYMPPRSEISEEADCFRLFLRLYPASAGIKDGHLISPYDLALSQNLNVYFLRLLLSADPTIDPVRRRNLNFAARRDGLFLAFRALSTNPEPTIWAKIRYEDKNLLARIISYL